MPDMIRAIVEGRKTVTRRVIKPQPLTPKMSRIWRWKTFEFIKVDFEKLMPLYARYKVGEVVYIKEAWWLPSEEDKKIGVQYDADVGKADLQEAKRTLLPSGWKHVSPLFMPEWAARYFIKIIDVKCERLQEITAEDCYKEGCPRVYKSEAIQWYQVLWDSINPKQKWGSNPFVWRYSFKLVPRP